MLPAPAIRGVFRTDYRARAAYAEAAGIYRILPAAVCIPSDTADLCQLVRWAATRKIPLVPRGAGSGMAGGNVGEGVVVDLTRLPLGLSVRPEDRGATTSANVTLADLNGAAGRHGLRLPPDPSSGRWATLGGMVSTNASGARSVRYGSVRRWVRAVELVTADAEVVRLRRDAPPAPADVAALCRFEEEAAPALRDAAELVSHRFPRTRKNSSGYALDAWLATGDLLDLVIGAEGTLGFVTEIEWLLEPIPTQRAGLRLRLRSLDEIVKVVAALHAAQPSAIELLDRTFLDLVRGQVDVPLEGVEAVLLVEIEREDAAGLRHAVEAAEESVRDMAVAVDVAFSPRAAERLWALRHAASPILAGLARRAPLAAGDRGRLRPGRADGRLHSGRPPGRGGTRDPGGDLRPRRRRPRPREPSPRGRARGLGGRSRRFARRNHRRSSSAWAEPRPASMAMGGSARAC